MKFQTADVALSILGTTLVALVGYAIFDMTHPPTWRVEATLPSGEVQVFTVKALHFPVDPYGSGFTIRIKDTSTIFPQGTKFINTKVKP